MQSHTRTLLMPHAQGHATIELSAATDEGHHASPICRA